MDPLSIQTVGPFGDKMEGALANSNIIDYN